MSDIAAVEKSSASPRQRPNLKRFGFALLFVAVVQSAALCWMIYDRISLYMTGKEVVLDTVPVDPRSLFRGDYVILNYGISRLNVTALQGDSDFRRDMEVYVTLRKPDQAGWQPVSATKKYPATVEKDHVVLRGKVQWGRDDNLRVKYGIEAYFVPEGQGKFLENQVRERKLQVLLAVGEDGEPAIKGLLIDGKLQYEETLF